MYGVDPPNFFAPLPLCRRVDVADDRLAALGDVDVLNGHLLLAATPVPLECLDPSGECPGELIEGVLGAVLLRDILDWARRRAKAIVAT